MLEIGLKLGIQTYQNLTNNDEVCIPSHSSILLAVYNFTFYMLNANSTALNI